MKPTTSNLKSKFVAYLENEAEACYAAYEMARDMGKVRRAWSWLHNFDTVTEELSLIEDSTAGWVARYIATYAADLYCQNALITGFCYGRQPIAKPYQLELFAL